MTSLLQIFCDIDDFCQQTLPELQKSYLPAPQSRRRERSLSQSEIMTILVAFHQCGYRNFKTFYTNYVCIHWNKEFPTLVSYTRFVEYIPSVIILMYYYLISRMAKCSGVSFIDSTKIIVCHNARIKQHKVFKVQAERSKTSTGFFFGFKLHIVFSDEGELLAFTVTRGNVDDRKPVPKLLKGFFGKVFGDKGYISKALSDLLFGNGIQLITQVKRNMKKKVLSNEEKLLLRKRSVIETVNDELKNICQVEHTRHRSISGFLLNIMGAIAAYSFFPKKPSIKNDIEEKNPKLYKDLSKQLYLAA